MEENTAKVSEFKKEVSKNNAKNYIRINTNEDTKSVGSYIIELYVNTRSKNYRSAILVAKKENNEYKVIGSKNYDEITYGKNVYAKLDNIDIIENYIKNTIDEVG